MSIFEKISGSVRYKVKYDELKEQATQLENTLSQINKKKNFLNKCKRKLQCCLQKEEISKQMIKDLNSKQQQAYLIRILMNEKRVNLLQDVENEIQKIKEKKELCQQKLASLTKHKLHIQTTLEEFENHTTVEEHKLATNNQEVNKINGEITELTIQIDKYISRLEKGSLEINNFEQQITELEHVLLITNEDIKRLEGNILPDYPMLDKNQINKYFQLEQELEMKTAGLPKELEILRSIQYEDENELKWENGSLDTLINKEKLIMLNIKKLETKKSSMQTLLVNTQKSEHEVISSLQMSKRNVERAHSSLVTLQETLKEVTDHLKNMSMDKYAERLEDERIATLEMLRKKFSGVFDRVINICSPISSKYTTCITKVFGRHMKSIVVTNDSVSVKCIEFLKENKRCRETFLPLESIKETPFNELLRSIEKPKGTIPMRDLLKYDLKYKRVIDHIVDNTVVCRTPEDAKFVAYTLKYNAVSLDGCRYWPSGIISGGEVSLEQKGHLWNQDFAKLQDKKIKLNEDIRNIAQMHKLELRTTDCLTEKLQALSKKIQLLEESIKFIESNILEETKVLHEHQNQKIIIQKKIENMKEELNKRNIQITEKEEKYKEMKLEIFQNFFSELEIPAFNLEDIRRNYYLQMEKEAALSNAKCALENDIEYEFAQKRKTEEKVTKLKNCVAKDKETLLKLQNLKEIMNEEIKSNKDKIKDINTIIKNYKIQVNLADNQIECNVAQIESLTSDELSLLRKHAIIQSEREGMQEELRSILLGCEAIGLQLPIQNLSFKTAVERALHGKDINAKFDYSCLPPEFVLLSPEELIQKYREINDSIDVLKIKADEIFFQPISTEIIDENKKSAKKLKMKRKGSYGS